MFAEEDTFPKGYFNEVKQPKTVHCKPMSALLDNPVICEDWGQGRPLHCLYRALSLFQAKHEGALPRPHVPADAEEVLDIAQQVAKVCVLSS